MLRRLALAVVGLALLVPAAPAPAAAHADGTFTVRHSVTTTTGGDLLVAGTVTNHTTGRRDFVRVTAEFRGPTGLPLVTATGPIAVANLAPHATSPFAFVVTDDAALVATEVVVTATGHPTAVKPSGALWVREGTLEDDTYRGRVRNQSPVDAVDIVVHAVRRDDSTFTALGASDPIDLAPGAETTYEIELGGSGDEIVSLTASTTAGALLTTWTNYFDDLGSSAFVAEIAWMAALGITRGCGTTAFCPDDPITREQMAIFLFRALDLPTAINPDPFTDIGSSPARVEIRSLHDFAIVTGCTPTTFCPKQPVTREQMAAFLDRAYDLAGTSIDFFTDDETSFAEVEINRLAASGITTGCTATTFCPRQTVTRGQMAAFIHRAEAARVRRTQSAR